MSLLIIIIVITFLLIIGYFVYLEHEDLKLLKTVTLPNRGTRSEREMVLILLKKGIPAQTIFHDLYFINKSGSISQVDLVVPTKVGIIVFEIKEYGGWLFGKGSRTNWTQVLAYGKEKYQFYNPIMQNQKHIESIINQEDQLKNIPFFSIVVFFGNCEFKDISAVPEDVYLIKSWEVNDILEKILSDNQSAKYVNKFKIVELLRQAVKNGDDETIREKHFSNIESMLKNKGAGNYEKQSFGKGKNPFLS
jgi:hypothetical protein